MKDIIESKDISHDEEVYLKKSNAFGWGVVHPIKNEDGSINWCNLIAGGSWWKLLVVGIIIAIIIGCVYFYSRDMNMMLDCFKSYEQLEICKQSFGYINNLLN